MRIVFYCVNGSGVGHLTRLVALAKWMRRYLKLLGHPAELVFLTSSEETSLLFRENLPSFKLPSKTAIGGSDFDKLTYLALAKQWVWHSLTLLRPDLLVVDSFPRGAFGELTSALDLVKKKAFVYRHMKSEMAARPDFQAMVALYDRIVLPEDAGRHAELLPPAAASRVSRVGPIVLREPAELLGRAEARRQLGVSADGPVILLTAGGGGDATAPARLGLLVDHLRRLGEVVVAAGPLYRGPRPDAAPGVVWLTEPTLSSLLSAFDVAVSAAGYNTFHELMLARVPSVFLPQDKVADAQDARARVAVEKGAAALMPALPDALLVEAVSRAVAHYLVPAHAAAARAAAASVAAESAASVAALELLGLVLTPAERDLARSVDGPSLLPTLLKRGLSFESYAEVLRTILGRDLDAAGARAVSSDVVTTLLDAVPQLADAAWLPVLSLLGRRLPAQEPGELGARAAAVRTCMRLLAGFGDAAAASIYLRTWGPAKGADLAAATADLTGRLESLGSRRRDLYDGLAELAGSARAEASAPRETEEAP